VLPIIYKRNDPTGKDTTFHGNLLYCTMLSKIYKKFIEVKFQWTPCSTAVTLVKFEVLEKTMSRIHAATIDIKLTSFLSKISTESGPLLTMNCDANMLYSKKKIAHV
jgi:hypothetical protein